MKAIFARNIGTVTLKEQEWLNDSTVFVAGAGSLGGFVAEYLVRMGVGNIRVADCGVFAETNLNRQIGATSENVGKSKVLELDKRLKEINKSEKIDAFYEKLTLDNAKKLLGNSLVAVDAFDNWDNKRMFKQICEELNIPYVYGSLQLNGGRVATIYPEDVKCPALFPENAEHVKSSETSMTVGIVAGFQATEVVNLILGKPTLKGKYLEIDTANHEFKKISF